MDLNSKKFCTNRFFTVNKDTFFHEYHRRDITGIVLVILSDPLIKQI